MGEPCQVCEQRTQYCCSDCAIDGNGKVYVCTSDTCRDTHERDHAVIAMKEALSEKGEIYGPSPAMEKKLRVAISALEKHPGEMKPMMKPLISRETTKLGNHEIGPSGTVDWTFAMTEEGHKVLNESGMTPRELQDELNRKDLLCAQQRRLIAELRSSLGKITDLVDSEADDPLDDAIRIATKALAGCHEP